MKLIVAEKPNVAKAIYPVVGAADKKDGFREGNGYIVSWCLGHLVGLSQPEEYGGAWGEKKWRFDYLPMIPEEWKFTVKSKTKSQFEVLKKLMSREDVDEIICATDADREGECIFRFVYQLANCKKPVKRLWVSSLEETAIKQALQNLKDSAEYDNLYLSGISRAKADWLVGMNLSRLFSCRYTDTLSVGRVKTPTLEMIVKRDSEVANFVKQKYFTVLIDCGKFTAASERIDKETEADELISLCSGKTATATKVNKETKTVNPPKLFDLTTLQREANKYYGYTAAQTLEYLQSLYETTLVTYPRTDSRYLTTDMQQTASDVVSLIGDVFDFGKVTNPDLKKTINDSKVTGHHAIIPTVNIKDLDLNAVPAGERNVLILIANRLLCAAAAPHKYEAVNVEVNCENHLFKASGKTILENGWKEFELKKSEKSDTEPQDKSIPEVTEGETFENVGTSKAEHWTAPPKLYTEDTLLLAMEHAGQDFYEDDTGEDFEKKGLGTPATRAMIIERLVNDKYIERNGKNIIPTEKGKALIEVLPEEAKSAKLTSEWEMQLQHITHGNGNAEQFMSDIIAWVKKICSEYSSVDTNSTLGNRPVIGICPRCGKRIYEGKLNFYCESGIDGCGFTLWKESKGLHTKVDKTAAEKLLKGENVKLKYISTENKECTSQFRLDDTGTYVNLAFVNAEKESIGKCPKCGGDVVKGKTFYCKNLCGAFLGKVYGKELTETQLKSLLSGKQISYTVGSKKTVVLPELVINSYMGKTSYQWKTKKGD